MIPLILPLIFIALTVILNKRISVLPFMNRLYKYTEKKCSDVYKFDFDEYFQLGVEIEELKQNIKESEIKSKNDEIGGGE